MRNAISNLQNTYLPYSVLVQQTSVLHEQLLGAICFSAEPINTFTSKDSDVPFLHVAMQPLVATAAMCEVWHSSAPLTQGQRGAITPKIASSLQR
jgi:hypothetical protein